MAQVVESGRDFLPSHPEVMSWWVGDSEEEDSGVKDEVPNAMRRHDLESDSSDPGDDEISENEDVTDFLQVRVDANKT